MIAKFKYVYFILLVIGICFVQPSLAIQGRRRPPDSRATDGATGATVSAATGSTCATPPAATEPVALNANTISEPDSETTPPTTQRWDGRD